MGYISKAHCSGCGYSEEFQLGSGLLDYDPKQIRSHLDLMDAWSVNVLAMEKESPIQMFRYRLGRCTDCGRLLTVPEVTLEDGTSFRGKACVCDPEQEHEIELFSEDDTEWGEVTCRKCGSKIEFERTGLWD